MLNNQRKQTWLCNPLGYISLKQPKIAALARINIGLLIGYDLCQCRYFAIRFAIPFSCGLQ